MPYRHPRGLSGQDMSDDEDDWPHLRVLRPPGSPVNQRGIYAQVEGVGDVHGGPATVRPRGRDASARRLGSTPRASAPLAEGAGSAVPDVYSHSVRDAIAAMHGSSSGSSSSSGRSSSSTSQDYSLSSSSEALSTDARFEEPDVAGGSVTPNGHAESPSQHDPLPLTGVEQLFAFLLLRGQTTVTQAAYRMVRRFFNAKLLALCGKLRPELRLPSLEVVRTAIAPRVFRA